jgi:hypothetical protein
MNMPEEYSLKGLVGEEKHILDPQVQANRHIDDIFDYSATSSQIEQWWYAKDPLNITDILKQEAVALTGNPVKINSHHSELFQQSLTSGRAGASLVADMLGINRPEANKDENSPANKKSFIGRIASRREIKSPKKSMQIGVLEDCLEKC